MVTSVGSTIPPRPGATGRMLRNASFVLAAEVGGKAASFALVLIMARELGASQYGLYAFALSFSAVVLTVGHFGQDQVLVREAAHNPQRLAELFASSLLLKVVLAAPVLGIALAVLAVTGTRGEVLLVVVLVSVAGIIELVTTSCFAAYQSLERMGFIPIVRIAQRLLATLLGVGVIVTGGTVAAVSLTYLVAALFAAILAYVFLRRLARLHWRVTVGRWWPILRAAVPIGIAGVLAAVLFRVDVLMLQGLTSEATVGLYSAAYRVLDITLFLGIGVGLAAYPGFARLGRHSEQRAGDLLVNSLTLAAVLTIPVAIIVGGLSTHVIHLLYGMAFSPATTALSLLAPSIALFPIAHLAGLFLVAQKQAILVAVVYAVVTGVNVALNLWLIPVLSISGAALTTSITEALLAVALITAVRRKVKDLTWSRAILVPGGAGLSCALAMLTLRGANPIVTAVGSMVAYLSVLGSLTWLSPSFDARGVVGAFRPTNKDDG
jgi:O-antigen/teichoic acid export membrane protein